MNDQEFSMLIKNKHKKMLIRKIKKCLSKYTVRSFEILRTLRC